MHSEADMSRLGCPVGTCPQRLRFSVWTCEGLAYRQSMKAVFILSFLYNRVAGEYMYC